MIKELRDKFREKAASKKDEIVAIKEWLRAESKELNSEFNCNYNDSKGTLSGEWPERFMTLKIAFLPNTNKWFLFLAVENNVAMNNEYQEGELEKLKSELANILAAIYV